MKNHIRNTLHDPEPDPALVCKVPERRIPQCAARGGKGDAMKKPAIVFARLRAFPRFWMQPRRHRGGLGFIGMSVIGLVIGVATVSVTVLPAQIASAVTSPEIYAPPDVVVGETDGSVTLPVTLNAASASTVTVNYATPTAPAATTPCATSPASTKARAEH
jgi:hypothetical protein